MTKLFLPEIIFSALLLTGCSTIYKSQQVSSEVTESIAIKGLTENNAFAWLIEALESRDKDLDCLTFRFESDREQGTVAEVWDFAAFEVHDEVCGGDPYISHVRDRYRVNSEGSIMIYDAANAEYKSF